MRPKETGTSNVLAQIHLWHTKSGMEKDFVKYAIPRDQMRPKNAWNKGADYFNFAADKTKTNMKKLKLIMLILAFPCMSLLAEDVPPTWKKVPVKPKEGNEDKRPVVSTPPLRSPRKTDIPDAYYDDSQGSLHVTQTETACAMNYIIMDAEGREVMRGTVAGNASHYYNVELPGLPAGTYLLLVEIGGREYEAWLTVD